MKDILGLDLYGQRVAHLNRALGRQRVEFEWTSGAMGATRNVQTVYIPDVATLLAERELAIDVLKEINHRKW